MPALSRNRIAKLIPAALLIILAIAGAETETAYLRKALGLEIGFSCEDWLGVYMDMSQEMDIDERLSLVEDEHIATVDVADGYQKFVLDYESAASEGVDKRILGIAEQGVEFNNAITDMAIEGEACCPDIPEGEIPLFYIMREYPKMMAYLSMPHHYEPDGCGALR